MNRSKAFVTALLGVLTAMALLAGGAQANYTASSYPTTMTATSPVGNDTINTEAGTVECASHFQATLASSSSSLTVASTYTSCKAFGFLSATVNMNGCDWLYTDVTVISAHHWQAKGKHLICPAGKAMTVSAGSCAMTIGSQSLGGIITITVITVSRDFIFKYALSGINYTVTTDGFGCPFSGTGAKAGATYTQDAGVTMDSTNGADIHVG